MTHIAVLALLVLTTARLAAQRADTLPIDTDRPDVTDGVHTVLRGYWQLETGYTYQRARGDVAGYSHSVPEALLRVGLASRIELRVGDNYLVKRDADAAAITISGFDDVYLGTKMSLTDVKHGWPALSVEAKLNLPTGGSSITAGRVLPGGAVLLGFPDAGRWSSGVEVFVGETTGGDATGVASLSVQYQATGRLQFYGEYFRNQFGSGGDGHEDYVNGGVLILLSNNVQVDARVGAGLNHAADASFIGFGFAVRK